MQNKLYISYTRHNIYRVYHHSPRLRLHNIFTFKKPFWKHPFTRYFGLIRRKAQAFSRSSKSKPMYIYIYIYCTIILIHISLTVWWGTLHFLEIFKYKCISPYILEKFFLYLTIPKKKNVSHCMVKKVSIRILPIYIYMCVCVFSFFVCTPYVEEW